MVKYIWRKFMSKKPDVTEHDSFMNKLMNKSIQQNKPFPPAVLEWLSKE